MNDFSRNQTRTIPAFISPAGHAVLDYGVAATFFAVGFGLLSRHRPAATLALINGAMVLGMSLLTSYPGGVYRVLSFKGHRTGDIAQENRKTVGTEEMGAAIRKAFAG